MRIVYRKLFRIRVRHGWYADAETRGDFSLVPTASTAALLEATALRVRHYPDGIAVFGEVEPDSDPPALLRPLGAMALRFAFELRVVNRALLGIAEVPRLQLGRTLLCFDNLREEIDAGRPLLGDSVADARVGPAVYLVTRSTYTHEFAAPASAATIRVLDRFGALAASFDVRSPQPLANCRIDLAAAPGLSPGRYTITDDQGISNSVYYDTALEASRPPAVVEIFSRTEPLTPDHTDRVPSGYRFLAGDTLAGIEPYHVQFEALATTWRYVVTKKYASNGIALDELAIDGPVTFVRDIAGSRAVFTSSGAVRFSETPRGLKLKKGDTPVRDLPEPGETTVLGEGAGSGGLVSSTFINV